VVTGIPSSRASPVIVTDPASKTTLYAAYSSGRSPQPAIAVVTSVRTRWPTANTSNSTDRCRPGSGRQSTSMRAVYADRERYYGPGVSITAP
jgi:hypothetical protein